MGDLDLGSYQPANYYAQHPKLSRLLREFGLSSRITHVLQIEHIRTARESGAVNVPPTAEWVLTERYVTDSNMVGRISRVINSDAYATHFELHLQLRGWMFSQWYMTDLGPVTCSTLKCGLIKIDEAWRNNTFLPEWARRYAPVRIP